MEDYVVAPTEQEWLPSSLEAFAAGFPRKLISEGRLRELVIAFGRLREPVEKRSAFNLLVVLLFG